MFICDYCKKIFHECEIVTIEEKHPYGDTTVSEVFDVSPCCNESYTEMAPCEICDFIPSDDCFYDEDFYLSGICPECFTTGLKMYFDEYIEREGLAIEFYIGFVETNSGYAYTTDQIVEILKREYKEFSQCNPDIANRERKDFITDGDEEHFVNFLISRMKK